MIGPLPRAGCLDLRALPFRPSASVPCIDHAPNATRRDITPVARRRPRRIHGRESDACPSANDGPDWGEECDVVQPHGGGQSDSTFSQAVGYVDMAWGMKLPGGSSAGYPIIAAEGGTGPVRRGSKGAAVSLTLAKRRQRADTPGTKREWTRLAEGPTSGRTSFLELGPSVRVFVATAYVCATLAVHVGLLPLYLERGAANGRPSVVLRLL